MNLDFTDEARRERFQAAVVLITDGFRILRDDVGVDNPSDNAFLREASVCYQEKLIWIGDRGGSDAVSASGEEVEIKSTRLDGRSTVAFPTSRYVSPTVIARFRDADWFAFAIFDLYERLLALYRVDRDAMKPLIDVLEERMLVKIASGKALDNNPKFPFASIRPLATVRYFDASRVAERNTGQRWGIVPR